jgi:hypothetical protein
MTLAPEQIKAFERDGFVQCGQALDDTRLAALRLDIERIVAELPPGTRPENMRVNSSITVSIRNTLPSWVRSATKS